MSNQFLKRAQYEAFSFTVLEEGVLVRNGSYTNPDDHEYLVSIRDGIPTRCTCPADRTYAPACKHRLAVAIRKPVLDAATQSASRQPVTDGGSRALPQDESEPAEELPEWCDCAELSGGFPCWECYSRGGSRSQTANGDRGAFYRPLSGEGRWTACLVTSNAC
ncbi:SWIM zinc finger family protein [Natronomonas sp. EA1]|uniref:SWIM zinc finger family protein n=1 Tax=Natronomonas sp. EA1 TaxID=3421655 RepID=UPI003EBB69B2